jgi:DNA-binding NtrC family response regulator
MIDPKSYDGFKIKSKRMLEVFKAVDDFASHGRPIIMFGPSGAGKEYLARYYFARYQKATNCKGDFVRVNCSHLVKETAQSTLFGHEKGAFTDAKDEKPGQFELAKGGVLFLDEIGDLDPSVQTMVNLAIDEKPAEGIRLGATEPYSTEDVIVICATEQPIEKLNDSLKYRTGLHINVPGLDERDEDVDEAIKHFCLRAIDKRLDKENVLSNLLDREVGKVTEKTYQDPDLEAIVQQIAKRFGPFVRDRDWPGNFRALRAAVDSGVIRAKRLNTIDDFIDDVEKYFLHHLGDYSIASEHFQLLSPGENAILTDPAISKWMEILSEKGLDINDKENIRLSQFLSEFEEIPFKRKIFQDFMKLERRVAQMRIKSLREDSEILEFASGKGPRYQVAKKYKTLIRQGIRPYSFMDLPETEQEDFMPEKTMEALGIIENTRGLVISDKDYQLREKFLGSLGNKLKESFDVIYFSFHKNSIDDFIAKCIEHLGSLNMDGWFKDMKDEKLELLEKISGLSGHMVQSLSHQRKTIIILEGIDIFNTGETQAFIEQLIYYWHPVKFVLGSTKQFLPQLFSNSIELSELKL